jgi:nitrate/TMAO reductase-like tetraheme cytochrome c subunit
VKLQQNVFFCDGCGHELTEPWYDVETVHIVNNKGISANLCADCHSMLVESLIGVCPDKCIKISNYEK